MVGKGKGEDNLAGRKIPAHIRIMLAKS